MSESGTLADDPHHCYPRSLAGGAEWWIEVEEENGRIALPIPHVVGLSREQHERVEAHQAWIKLEDGVWNWYERTPPPEEEKDRWERETGQHRDDYPVDHWELIGPLDPQPGYTSTSKSRKRKQGEARRKRRTISIRVPTDSENGGEIWDEKFEQVCVKLIEMGLYSEEDRIPVYEATIAAWTDWLNG